MIGVIINPFSRRNLGRRGLKRRYERILRGHGRVIETLSTDAVAPALRQFEAEGRRYWVADGGDGALHWMVNAAVRFFGNERAVEVARYVPTGGGSVDFVAKSLGIDRDPEAVLARLVATVARGGEPKYLPVRSIEFVGTQVLYGDHPEEFRRVGFGAALAGYGGNFFGPLHEGSGRKSPARIAALMASAFGAAATRAALRGPLEALKPGFVRKAEHDFLRPLRARVAIDGEALRDPQGAVVTEHTVLQLASLPLNLAGILRVFPLADTTRLHVQAGRVTPVEMARVWPRLMTGGRVQHLLSAAFDGPASRLEIECLAGDEMNPVIDGEMFLRINSLAATLGPLFQMAVP